MFRRLISALLSYAVIFVSLFTGIFPVRTKLRLAVPENWELNVGDSRTVDAVFSEKVSDRRLTWSVQPPDVASVDKWGRVTALSPGVATITAAGNGIKDSVRLNVTDTPTLMKKETRRVDYKGTPAGENGVLQKFVTRYPAGSPEIPAEVADNENNDKHQKVTTGDGATWAVTNYGVLRLDPYAANARDRQQRLMGDRYFYENDSGEGNILAVYDDGNNGIWAKMRTGVTHIAMLPMGGSEKAAYLSAVTQLNNYRHGFVAEAYGSEGSRSRHETDNDGLWTSMYAVGELMRYATLRNDPSADPETLAEAKKAAYSASEAVLTLYYISMRTGTVESYIRYKEPEQAIPGDASDRMLSAAALESGGDPSIPLLAKSPADSFNEALARYRLLNSPERLECKGYYQPKTPESWSDPRETAGTGVEYEKQTRLIEGFPMRTFSLKSEPMSYLYSGIHWSISADGTATGIAADGAKADNYILNNENLRGETVDASGTVPARLWNDVIGAEHSPDEIIYKSDTSADELVGHMMLFKVMYDILADEDPELGNLIATACDRLAQHLSDNSYMMVDATGQPATWSNFNRGVLASGSSVAETPLHAMVLLSVFKVAAYVTGYQKWEDEYHFAATDPAYEYAGATAQQYERMVLAAEYAVGKQTHPVVGNLLDLLKNTNFISLAYRSFHNYSSEEMAMLTFYTLFQLENDKTLLKYYRRALDDWWITAGCGENPLWYLIYQLAYPEKEVKDALGNYVIETAAWSLSRHPTDLVSYSATNPNRDDLSETSLAALGLKVRNSITYDIGGSPVLPALSEKPDTKEIIRFALKLNGIKAAVAAPDERAHHKYNDSTYPLGGYHYTNQLTTSTTYTLPYWLGVYHGMIEK
ncbi:MAG: Ig-like domain-containing protein [Clostridiales bacterium]|nr:Ig-like domain-containing protein [Clostridiales bacterium]